eukprot:Rhum_TRINITY_DN7744_c0_g1::Rhum_TRINITY_DN7744_c0_g1_i1::g.24468::m.24468
MPALKHTPYLCAGSFSVFLCCQQLLNLLLDDSPRRRQDSLVGFEPVVQPRGRCGLGETVREHSLRRPGHLLALLNLVLDHLPQPRLLRLVVLPLLLDLRLQAVERHVRRLQRPAPAPRLAADPPLLLPRHLHRLVRHEHRVAHNTVRLVVELGHVRRRLLKVLLQQHAREGQRHALHAQDRRRRAVRLVLQLRRPLLLGRRRHRLLLRNRGLGGVLLRLRLVRPLPHQRRQRLLAHVPLAQTRLQTPQLHGRLLLRAPPALAVRLRLRGLRGGSGGSGRLRRRCGGSSVLLRLRGLSVLVFVVIVVVVVAVVVVGGGGAAPATGASARCAAATSRATAAARAGSHVSSSPSVSAAQLPPPPPAAAAAAGARTKTATPASSRPAAASARAREARRASVSANRAANALESSCASATSAVVATSCCRSSLSSASSRCRCTSSPTDLLPYSAAGSPLPRELGTGEAEE